MIKYTENIICNLIINSTRINKTTKIKVIVFSEVDFFQFTVLNYIFGDLCSYTDVDESVDFIKLGGFKGHEDGCVRKRDRVIGQKLHTIS